MELRAVVTLIPVGDEVNKIFNINCFLSNNNKIELCISYFLVYIIYNRQMNGKKYKIKINFFVIFN